MGQTRKVTPPAAAVGKERARRCRRTLLGSLDRALGGELPGTVVLCALIGVVGAMGLGVPQVLGTGYGTIERLAAGGVDAIGIGVVAALVVWKLLATSMTMGCGGAAGVFAPALLMGAALGAAFGAGVQAATPDSLAAAPSGAYPVIGMCAVLAASTHAALTAECPRKGGASARCGGANQSPPSLPSGIREAVDE